MRKRRRKRDGPPPTTMVEMAAAAVVVVRRRIPHHPVLKKACYDTIQTESSRFTFGRFAAFSVANIRI